MYFYESLSPELVTWGKKALNQRSFHIKVSFVELN